MESRPGTNDGMHPVYVHPDFTPNPRIRRFSHFSPHMSGLPPDPVPPLRLQTRRWSACLLKLGETGAPLRVVSPKGAKPRGSSTLGLRVLGWAHGVGRVSRAPSHSRARARSLLWAIAHNPAANNSMRFGNHTGNLLASATERLRNYFTDLRHICDHTHARIVLGAARPGEHEPKCGAAPRESLRMI